MELFTLTNQLPVLNTELRTIKAFRDLIAADKDRHKRLAVKELAYIYYTLDYRSPYYNYPPKEREGKIVEDLDLGKDWRPSKLLKAAMKSYEEKCKTASMEMLEQSINTLHTSVTTLGLLREKLEESLEVIRNLKLPRDISEDELREGTLQALTEARTALINGAVNSLEKLLSLSKKIPEAIASQKELLHTVQREQAGKERIRGGGSPGMFED